MSTSVYESAQLGLDATLGALGTGASQPLDPAANPLTRAITFPDGTVHQVQPLVWGGTVFYDQPTFDAWAAAHGTTSARIFANHPEAQRIYAQLAPEAVEATIVAGETIANLRVLAVLPTQADGPAGALLETMTVTFELIGAPGQFSVEVPFTASWPSYAVSAMLAEARQVSAIYAIGG